MLRALLAFDISANLLFNLLANLPGYLVTLFPLHFGANIAGNIDALSAGDLFTDGPRHVSAHLLFPLSRDFDALSTGYWATGGAGNLLALFPFHLVTHHPRHGLALGFRDVGTLLTIDGVALLPFHIVAVFTLNILAVDHLFLAGNVGALGSGNVFALFALHLPVNRRALLRFHLSRHLLTLLTGHLPWDVDALLPFYSLGDVCTLCAPHLPRNHIAFHSLHLAINRNANFLCGLARNVPTFITGHLLGHLLAIFAGYRTSHGIAYFPRYINAFLVFHLARHRSRNLFTFLPFHLSRHLNGYVFAYLTRHLIAVLFFHLPSNRTANISLDLFADFFLLFPGNIYAFFAGNLLALIARHLAVNEFAFYLFLLSADILRHLL